MGRADDNRANEDRADERLVQLGVVAGAHGVRGEVKLTSFTERPEDIAAYGPLRDESGARSFSVSIVRSAKGGVIARIEGIGDRDAAEALKGTGLYVRHSALPAPEPDSWYHEDLIGLAAEDAKSGARGRVVSVQNFGAGDLLEIAFTGRRGSDYVPFTRAFAPGVDISAGRIALDLPEDFFSPGKRDETEARDDD